MKLKLNFKIIILFLLMSFIIPITYVNADGNYFNDSSIDESDFDGTEKRA